MLGLEPDVTYRKGDRVTPRSQSIRKSSLVEFYALREEEPIGRLGEYLSRLVPPLESLAGLPPEAELDAWVSIGVRGRDMGNVLFLSRRSLHWSQRRGHSFRLTPTPPSSHAVAFSGWPWRFDGATCGSSPQLDDSDE